MTPLKFDELSRWFQLLAKKQLNAYRKKGGADAQLGDGWLSLLKDAYEDSTKNAIKSFTKTGASTRLDRHKIAAALLMAILRAQPFILPSHASAVPSRYREATALLAIEIGCIVILLFGITEANLTTNPDLAKVYDGSLPDRMFDLPTGNGDGNYISQLVKAINFARQADGPIPDGYALLLSHVYFLLQCLFERNRCQQLKINPLGPSMNLAERMRAIEALPG